jgi:hypothetical protein
MKNIFLRIYNFVPELFVRVLLSCIAVIILIPVATFIYLGVGVFGLYIVFSVICNILFGEKND